MKRVDGGKPVHRGANKRRSDTFCKQSEMLEIRISLPLKQALAEHCRSKGINRSAFVRAAIGDRIERDRRGGFSWAAARDSVLMPLQSHSRSIMAASLIVFMGFFSALSLRPDTSSMLIMLEMTELIREIPAEASAGASLGEFDRGDA